MRNSVNFQRLSDYFFYVASLIFRFNFTSVFKVNICSLILRNRLKDLVSSRNKNDIINIFFSSLRPVLLTSNSDFIYILMSIDLLKECGFIAVEGDIITKLEDMSSIPSGIIKGKMLTTCLNDLKILSDKSFIEEVLYYV